MRHRRHILRYPLARTILGSSLLPHPPPGPPTSTPPSRLPASDPRDAPTPADEYIAAAERALAADPHNPGLQFRLASAYYAAALAHFDDEPTRRTASRYVREAARLWARAGALQPIVDAYQLLIARTRNALARAAWAMEAFTLLQPLIPADPPLEHLRVLADAYRLIAENDEHLDGELVREACLEEIALRCRLLEAVPDHDARYDALRYLADRCVETSLAEWCCEDPSQVVALAREAVSYAEQALALRPDSARSRFMFARLCDEAATSVCGHDREQARAWLLRVPDLVEPLLERASGAEAVESCLLLASTYSTLASWGRDATAPSESARAAEWTARSGEMRRRAVALEPR